MIHNPYLLLLLLVFPAYFLIRKRVKFYFRHAYIDNLSSNTARETISWRYAIFLGMFFLILAASNIVLKTKESVRSYQVHKYVLVNDGSGSMVNVAKENGIGRELNAVLAGNDKLFDFLGNRKDGSKDLVGAIVFSNDAFTVSNLTDDPKFVQKKLKRIDYRVSPLAAGTDIEAGLWASLEMLLASNVDQDELDHLQFKCFGIENEIKLDDKLNLIVDKKDKLAGSSVIIFTDGIFNPYGNKSKLSSFKIIDFCRLIGVRVYFISLFDLDKKLISFCKATGGRGEVVAGYDQKRLEEIYDDIVKSQANEYVVKETTVDHALSDFFGIAGLSFMVIGLLMHLTIQLNFTEV